MEVTAVGGQQWWDGSGGVVAVGWQQWDGSDGVAAVWWQAVSVSQKDLQVTDVARQEVSAQTLQLPTRTHDACAGFTVVWHCAHHKKFKKVRLSACRSDACHGQGQVLHTPSDRH